MIRFECSIDDCNMVARYADSMEEHLKQYPPFCNIPLTEGEHEHDMVRVKEA